MTVFAHNPAGFLTMTRTLYPATQQDILHPRTRVGKSKLEGRHEWPFTFVLPKGVSILTHIMNDAVRRKFRLPPSVDDDVNGVHVRYRLEIRVDRGRFRSTSR